MMRINAIPGSHQTYTWSGVTLSPATSRPLALHPLPALNSCLCHPERHKLCLLCSYAKKCVCIDGTTGKNVIYDDEV